MLEVHPPHHSANSWRDFLIHIATICVGLLIAVGLEQCVEAVHHHHQRQQLQEDLRLEAESNRSLVMQDLKIQQNTVWAQQAMDAVASAAAHRGVIEFSLSPAPCRPGTLNTPALAYFAPSDAVWATAKESGLTELLPPPEARIYQRLAHNLDLASAGREHVAAACDRVFSLQRRLSKAAANGGERAWSLTPEQAERLAQAAADMDTALRDLVFRLRAVLVCEEAIISGARDFKSLVDGISRINLDDSSLP